MTKFSVVQAKVTNGGVFLQWTASGASGQPTAIALSAVAAASSVAVESATTRPLVTAARTVLVKRRKLNSASERGANVRWVVCVWHNLIRYIPWYIPYTAYGTYGTTYHINLWYTALINTQDTLISL